MSTPPAGGTPVLPVWAPGTSDVARHVARFTRNAGVIAGDFSDTTVPTAAQVLTLVEGRVDDVSNAAGTVRAQAWADAPTGVGARAARWVVALGVASDVALSYYSSSGNTAASDLATDLEARYVAALDRLLSGGGDQPAAIDGGPGGAGGDTSSSGGVTNPPSPAGAFPPAVYDRGWY